MKTNHLIFLFILTFLVLGLLSFAGCDMGDMIHVKTPNTIQQQTGLANDLWSSPVYCDSAVGILGMSWKTWCLCNLECMCALQYM